MLRDAPLAPPVVELGRLAGWDPLPLSVRDARRAGGAAARAAGAALTPTRSAVVPGRRRATAWSRASVVVRYGDKAAVRGVDFEAAPGEVVALMGRNGSGQVVAAVGAAGRRPA